MIKSKYFRLFTGIAFGALLMWVTTSCEGPMGPDGKNGSDGKDGKDANATCTQCHNPTVVQPKVTQFELSKHFFGTVAEEEAGGSTGCTPCHESEGFKYVCKNNIPATFTLNTTTGKYVNDYAATTATGYGSFTCNTCHSSLHTTDSISDLYPLTNMAAVPMTMWAGKLTINLTQDGSKSNLCVKCHQPRPLTSATDGNVIDYASLATNPTALLYDSAAVPAAPNKIVPSYRTHVHYGGIGAIYAGKGGVEFPGSLAYTSSAHTTTASCSDCHMADMYNAAGGHSFVAKGNFNGCNVSGCHATSPLSSTASKFKDTRTTVKGLLDALAAKFTSGGVVFLHSEPDPTLNLWAGLTTNNYDGYINIYDPSTNPAGAFRNPAPSSSWTTAQKATNTALPKFTSLKNVQVGAMINFQLCLREFSLGIHNTAYSKALLQNSIDALTAAGF